MNVGGRPAVTTADPRIPELVRIYRESRKVCEAAKAVRMNQSTAGRLLRELGEMKPWKVDWEKLLPQARALKARGVKVAEIARILGLKKTTAGELFARLDPDRVEYMPSTHRVFGTVRDDPKILARRIADYVERYGSAALIRSREGRIAAALPGTRVYAQAEAEDAIVCTYTAEAPDPRGVLRGAPLRHAIAEDIRHAAGM